MGWDLNALLLLGATLVAMQRLEGAQLRTDEMC